MTAIASTGAPGRGRTDGLLFELAERLVARGVRVCGVVQRNRDRADGRPGEMELKVLPAGPVLRISQDLGPGARGCRLDPDALETAAGHVAAHLDAGAELLIVNKFGKQEAQGGGLRQAILAAASAEVPVLVGVNAANRAAFDAFAGGAAATLPPDPGALLAWAVSQMQPVVSAAPANRSGAAPE